jgi:hypothetical protein
MTKPPESDPCALCGGLTTEWCRGCERPVCDECDLDGLRDMTFRHRVEDHQETWWDPEV